MAGGLGFCTEFAVCWHSAKTTGFNGGKIALRLLLGFALLLG
jgi:hypothetical protein